MALKLSEQEIKQRLIEWRNLKKLHAKDQKIKADLKHELRLVRAQMAEMAAQFEAITEAQTIRIAELERMVFGRKKDKDETPPDDIGRSGNSKDSKPLRTKDSYHRPTPSTEAITEEEYIPVSKCGHCHGPLTNLEEYVRYIEDIVLATLTDAGLGTVTKLTIQRGWCTRCGKYTAARDLRGQEVSLGPNVRLLVSYLTTILDMTYSQVRTLLGDLYGFRLAESEIASILQSAGRTYRSEYEAIKARIRSGPAAHLDESPYHIQENDNSGYAWAMAGADGTPTEHDVVFKLADGRGKGNAEELLGPDYLGVRITDGYRGYKYLPGSHQQCWAHLYRIIRDLAQISTLPENKRAHVEAWLKHFRELYATLRRYTTEPYDQTSRAKQAEDLRSRVRILCRLDSRDPKKLASLKTFMLEYEHALVTCLIVPGVPADNNKAERVIRKLVLKRKKSFGCKTNQGAKALEVMLSVCWSTWYRERENFFPAMQALVGR
jgi:hypothetical protein